MAEMIFKHSQNECDVVGNVQVGDDVQVAIIDGKRVFKRVTEILESRPSKGQFANEKDRWTWNKVLVE